MDTTEENFNLDNDELTKFRIEFKNLDTLWESHGVDKNQRVIREKNAWTLIQNLMQEILGKEILFFENLKERIKQYNLEIEDLSKCLSVIHKENNSKSLIEKEENLRRELYDLKKLKQDRVNSYNKLKNVESRYCSILGVAEYKLPTEISIPSENDIREIKKQIEWLKTEEKRKYKKIYFAKVELSAILETTELTMTTSFGQDIFSKDFVHSLTDESLQAVEELLIEAKNRKISLENEIKNSTNKLKAIWDRLKIPESTKQSFLLKHSTCNVSTLESIKKELDKYEEIKKENMQEYGNNLRLEMKQLWEKCYVSELEKKSIQSIVEGEITENIINSYEAEIDKWTLYFTENERIISKIEKRKRLWDMLLDLENKTTDPNRFKNRKGYLLKEEKERKKLKKGLSGLEEEIFLELEQYKTRNSISFQYYGKDFKEFILSQWKNRIISKEYKEQDKPNEQLLTVENERRLKNNSTPKSVPSKFVVLMNPHRTPITSRIEVKSNTVGKCQSSNIGIAKGIQKFNIRRKLFNSEIP